MASVGLDKSRKSKTHKHIKFQYFTISFNEELSALYGPLLEMQTEFAKHCVEHILSLFENVKPESKRPRSVLIIGNSMGGLVARGLLLPDNNNQFQMKNLIHTIITQASPHNKPVINLDSSMAKFYNKVNQFWLNKSETALSEVLLASLYGGTR